MTYFQNLEQIVASLEADTSTKNDPIKRTFVFDGEHLTANVGVIADSGNALHIQNAHDELLVIIEGNVEFKVGEEIKHVKKGDLIFIPKATLHGPVLKKGQSFAALSVFAPHFDRTKNNIQWDKDS